MSEENIKAVLKNFGLTAIEADIYLFLSKKGILKGSEIAKQTKKDKGQIYQLLKSLQAKGLIESTLEKPVRFKAIPFENIVELSIKAKRDEATQIESTKQELINHWKSINKNKLEILPEKNGKETETGVFKSSIESTKNQTPTKNKWRSKKTVALAMVTIIVFVGVIGSAEMQQAHLDLSNLPNASPTTSTYASPSPSMSMQPSDSPTATVCPLTSLIPSPITTENPPPSLNIAAKFYNSPEVSTEGTSVSLPYDFVNTNKIVNVEVKLQSPTPSLNVGERTVNLTCYRDADYLPLLVIVTPQQHLIAAVRVCEPCHCFSFTIVDGVLQCDYPCHTRWNLENLEGIGGMCANVPPPRLPASIIGNNIVIDFSSLGVKADTTG